VTASGATPDAASQAAALAPTWFLDWEHPAVASFTEAAIGDAVGAREQAARLFAAIRDGIWYDPYTASLDPEDFRASRIVSMERTWCVPKAVLLTACARSVGIPARLGFADVRNHLQTGALRERMGSDLFVYHGYSALLIDELWVKATPAFNRELCARFGVAPIEFDGQTDALLHPFTGDGSRHMEYVRDHGCFDDLPLDDIASALRAAYPISALDASAADIDDHFTR
jgi:transglutaminase-like putative cysteine protease